MEIDDYLSQLRNELDESLNQLRTSSFDGTINHSNPPTDNSMMYCPECGAHISADSNFCPNCGTRLTEEQPFENAEDIKDENAENTGNTGKIGILLTDSNKLSEKYDEEVTSISEKLEKLIQNEATCGIQWKLLDAANYKQKLGSDPFWLNYNELISDFMETEKMPYGIQTPVFIIGGDDVIPIPMVEDVFGSSDDGRIPCDMCYCFPGTFFSDLWDGDRTITEKSVRNNISRLPLEDGYMNNSDFDYDVVSYFNFGADFLKEGISANQVLMTANASWIPASKTMSEHLPLTNNADSEMVVDGMYVSPPISPDDEDTMEPYKKSMRNAGMLLFNLHGSCESDKSSFYNDDGEAFTVDMLAETPAKVLNTVACYGARYHGFERSESMLLSAMYYFRTLLYAGSLIPVPMLEELDVPDGVEVHEGSGSEHLMPIYCMEQYAGLPAGEAMMKAKLEYFNTFRLMERDDFSLSTIMMFSLYGHPFLRLQRDEQVLANAERLHVLPKLPQAKQIASKPVQMKRMQRICDKKEDKRSMLEELRGLVDENIASMHKIIQQSLYEQLGLEPRWLNSIDSYSIGKEKGFLYTYVDKSKKYGNKTMAEVDTNGNVRKIIKMK